MRIVVRVVAILCVVGLFLPGCAYVPEEQLDEHRARLSEQQQTISAQQMQIEELAEKISLNRGQLHDVEQQYQNLQGRVQELDVSESVPATELKANVRMSLSPSSTVCEGDSVIWSALLTETKGVGVTFTESVIWYRVREHVRSFPGPFDVTYSNSSTDPLLFPLYVLPYGSVECSDLGSDTCFSEERHYYHVFFGRDDNGNEVVVAGKVIVNEWTAPEEHDPEWHTTE